MILDKLIEKKDLHIYIRIDEIKRDFQKLTASLETEKISVVQERNRGRVEELQKLKTHLHELKPKCKQLYHKIKNK